MLSKCANPECSTPFVYLRDGKVFRVEKRARPVSVSRAKPPLSVEHFWLCGQCWQTHTLDSGPNGEVRVLPKKSLFLRRAAAS